MIAAVACGLDAAVGRNVDGVAMLAAAGLGGAWGLVVGTGHGLLDAGLRRLPAVAGFGVWLLVGALGGAWLVHDLGALARLSGPHAGLAWLTLLVGGGGGLAWGLFAALLQARPQHPAGLLAARPSRRWLAVGLLALAATGLLIADRRLFVDLYPNAHVALEVAFFWSLTAAIVTAWGRPWPGGRIARISLIGLALIGFIGAAWAMHGADRHLAALLARPLPALTLDATRAVTDGLTGGQSTLFAGGAAPIDEDGADVDEAAEPTAAPLAHPSTPAPMSVVLITIDTLRPDHTSTYGYARETTPNLTAFAQSALRFDRAYTAGAWTSLAVPALMRGVYARRLRWTRVAETNRYRLLRVAQMGDLDDGERLRLMFGLPLADPHPTLAERLRARGMHTVAVVDDGYSQFLDATMGAAAGFDDFRSVDAVPRPQRNDAATTTLALNALIERPADRRFFLWVHYFGPHDPSTRSPDVPWYGDSVPDAYDHEIRFVDAQLGRLLARLDGIAAQEPLAVVITSDHGERFFEKRRMHGVDVNEHSLRIPLLLRAPGITPGTTPELASLIDIAPTLLALTDTPAGRLDGRDLRRVAEGQTRGRHLIAETWRFDRRAHPVRDLIAVFDGRYKVIADQVRRVRLLVDQRDLSDDPADLRGEVPAPELEATLDRYLKHTHGGRVDLHD